MILATTFVIDVSGSMAGSTINATIRGIKKIFDMHEPRDRIALKVFNSSVVDILGLKQKRYIDWSRLTKSIRDAVCGRTAMYDAIALAMKQTNHQPTIKVSDRYIPCQREIVVFTDGEDNMSR